jgi:hypothetical protein
VKNFRRLILFAALYVLASSCDAPHLNNLDPSSPGYNLGQLGGTVTGVSNTPLQYVRVIWKNQNIITTTDSLGEYTFQDITIKSGWITFERDEYVKDSIYVNWTNGSPKSAGTKQLVKNVGSVDGYVYSSSTPGEALSNVQVVWKNQNIVTETNSSGYFKFESIPNSDGYLTFDKDGFVTDSTYVQWNKQTTYTIRLNYSKGKVSGTVISKAGNIIAGASVTLKGENIVVKTNSSGYYEITNLQHQDDTLLFQADGYSDITAPLIWSNKSRDVEVNIKTMNANPKLNDLRIFTSIVNTYIGTKRTLYIQAKVTDENVSDVDTVFVSCADLNISKVPLEYNFSTGYFEISFVEGSEYLSSLENATGKYFEIIVRDKERRVFNIGYSFIKRIIRDQITPYSPINGAAVGINPKLVWKRFKPGYSFRYFVQVYTTGQVQQLVWQKDNISQDDIDVTVTTNLTPGQNYYWVIWCIDEYQNRSCSVPGTFVVQ